MLDIVIIGAGAAGLAAARRLQDKGASFRLLEAKPHIGGRLVTDSVTLGAPIDLGGHWLHSPALNPLTPLVDRYLFHVKQGAEDFRVARGGTILTGAEHDDCFAYVEDCFAKIAAIDSGEHDCPVSELFPFRGKWHDFFEANFIAKQGMPLAQSSAFDFARYVWEGDDWPVLDGFGALIARHAQGIPVELETPATRITWSGKTGVAIETPRGTIEARAAIIAVSTGVLASEVIRFTPSLPDWKQQAIDDLPLGSCNKVALGFTRNPFGDLDTVMLMPDLGAGPSVEFVVREGGRNIVTTMLNGPHAKALAAEGARASADYALTQLAAIFGNEVKACVTDRLVFADWDHDPWVRGCYAAAKIGRYHARGALARPVESRLFFAGEAAHDHYMGDVHGAHLSGEAAAEAALAVVRAGKPIARPVGTASASGTSARTRFRAGEPKPVAGVERRGGGDGLFMSGRTKGLKIKGQQLLDPAVIAAAAGAMPAPFHPDFHQVVEALPAAVYVTDAEGRITYYNEAAVALWGYEPPLGDSRWCGSWRLYRLDGTPMPHDQCPMAMAIKENRAITGMEAIAERPDGSRVRFMPFPKPLHNETGTLIGAVNMLVDVTDRRRTEERLAAIIESSEDAVISKSLDGVIMTWNSGAERLFGYTAAEAIGRPVTMLIPPERIDEEPGILARIRRGERIEHYDTVRRRKDGSAIDISLTVSPIRDSDGAIIGASKIARDITERKQAEQRQQLLVGEVKHRIKNLLATVQAIARQTLKGAPVEDREAFVARLMALANAQDLLTLERWNRAAVREVIDRALRPFEAKHSARFLTKGPEDVWVDAQRASLLTMALHELATNAVKYGALSNGYGVVSLSWKVTGEEDAQSVRLTWQELGGPLVVPPERKGFGSFLIERALQGSGGGGAKLDFNPNGLICSLEVAL